MNLSKREFLQVLGAGSVAGMGLGACRRRCRHRQQGLYDLPFGNVSLLHMTDCHAQLKPIYFREPSVNLGIGSMQGQLPHLVGEHLLKVAGVRPGTPRPTPTPTSTSRRPRAATARWAASPTWPRWSSAEGQPPRRAAARRRRHLAGLGHRAVDQRARTWSTPASCWAWT
jgi:hypothetical protein